MRLRNFFKKEKTVPDFSVRSKKEMRQHTSGEMPLADIGGYISPSGGFVNYARFRISGVNHSTDRKSEKRYEAQDEAAARAAAQADGLTEPLTVKVEKERQIDYALELGAMIPEGACKNDLSAIISRIVECDEAAPDPGLSRYAHASGVKFSRFVGAYALLGDMVRQMRGPKLGELFAYGVYLREKGGQLSDPRLLPIYNDLTACGEFLATDPVLLKGLDINGFRRLRRDTKIYKAAFDFLKRQGVL